MKVMKHHLAFAETISYMVSKGYQFEKVKEIFIKTLELNDNYGSEEEKHLLREAISEVIETWHFKKESVEEIPDSLESREIDPICRVCKQHTLERCF